MAKTRTPTPAARASEPSPAGRPPAPGPPLPLLAALAGAGAGNLVASWRAPTWNAVGLATPLAHAARVTFAGTLGVATVAGLVLGIGFSGSIGRRGSAALRMLALVGFLPVLLDATLWSTYPALTIPLACLWTRLLVRWWPRPPAAPTPAVAGSHAPAILTAAAIAVYVVSLSILAIGQHRMLQTRAYDMAIMENVLWNTAHGRWFQSALEHGSHLGVHSSFILLLLVPFYALVPRAESLLVAQSILLGVAAWPAFLLARRMVDDGWAAATIAIAYLIHPAVAGANLYDFHELAFAPILFFLAVWALHAGRRPTFWIAVVLLLLVKEDLSIVVALLGGWLWWSGRRRLGLGLLASGALGYVVLQHQVIPFFAGGAHSYAWYYSDMAKDGEGPAGVLLTLLMSPVQSLAFFLTPAKVGYLCAVFGPFAFLPLRAGAALLPMLYGSLIAVASSRPPLYQLGFQYGLLLVPPAILATLVALRRHAAVGEVPAGAMRGRVAVVAVMSLLAWVNLGLARPGNGFSSGFRRPTFRFEPADVAAVEEVDRFVELIPGDASVTASETVVPQLARRTRVETLRYAATNEARGYRYFLVLKSDLDSDTIAAFPEVFGGTAYALERDGSYAALFRRREP